MKKYNVILNYTQLFNTHTCTVLFNYDHYSYAIITYVLSTVHELQGQNA